MRMALNREKIKESYLKNVAKYGSKGDNFLVQVINEEGNYHNREGVREILSDLAMKGEI